MNKIDIENTTINGEFSYLLDYYKQIFYGDWIVGYELKKLLKKMVDDLERYEYKMKLSHKRIDFMQKLCRQTKNRFFGKPLKLMKWQKALIEVMYSFRIPNTKKRRFQQVLLMVARKNGKSTLAAGDCNTDLFIGGGGLDICCSSNADAQADLVFQEIDNMRSQIDPSDKRTKRNKKGLSNKINRSRIFKISDKTRNKEGRNITKAVIDEVHEMKDNTIFMSIWQSTSVVENPIVWEITTEGTVENGYLDKRLQYARKVLNDEVEDEELLVWLYSQDSEEEIWTDRTSWWKSNPSLGEVKQWEHLEKNVNDAKTKREDRAFILCKDFNIKQNKAIAWLLEEEATNDESFTLEDFRGSFYIGGIDLSDTTDLTAVNLMFMKNKKPYFHHRYFIPYSKAKGLNDTNREQVDYEALSQKGLVTILPGNEVNYDAITQYLWDMYKEYDLKPFKIGYDLWNARGLITDIEDKFGADRTIKIRMDFNTLSNPMRSLGADLKDKRVNYQNNELTKSNLKNVAVKTNNNGQIMPVKVHGTKSRIDGALTMIISYATYSIFKVEFDARTVGDE